VNRPDLFDGIVALTARGKAAKTPDWNDALYRTAPPKLGPAKLTAIPYFLWSNRETGPMTVWIPEG
jgi:DUF1680 family protein